MAEYEIVQRPHPGATSEYRNQRPWIVRRMHDGLTIGYYESEEAAQRAMPPDATEQPLKKWIVPHKREGEQESKGASAS